MNNKISIARNKTDILSATNRRRTEKYSEIAVCRRFDCIQTNCAIDIAPDQTQVGYTNRGNCRTRMPVKVHQASLRRNHDKV